MAGAGRDILTTNLELKLESGDKYIHQFDKTVYEEGKVSLNNGSPAKNVTVSIIPCNNAGRAITYDKNKIGAYIPAHEITGVKSSFKMPYGPTSVPGEYYCLMEAKSTINNVKPSQKKIIMVVKEQNEKAVIDWGDENQYKNVYKGCKYKYHINFKIQNKLGVDAEDSSKLKGLPVNFTFIHTGGKRETTSTTIEVDSEGKCYAEAIISYRGYYNDNSYLEVELDEIQGYGMVKGQKLITHPWYFAKTYNDLLGQFYLVNSSGEYVNEKGVKIGNGNNVSQAVPNDFGCDWIFLENGKHNISKTLYINRNVTIASPSGTGHSILDGNGSLNIIKTQSIDPSSSNLMKVNLIGLSFQHGECAINSGEGTRLLLERCYFTENQNNNQHHKGSSVFVADNDYNINHRGNWKTEIRNCYFKNNKGNEIQIVGDVRVVNSLFVTVESKWLQQPEVKVISILAGNATYENNKSYINAGKKNMISNHSWAKALCYIGEKATFNGKGPAELNYYDKLPVFGNPWNNECYTYAIYWYDYGYNTTLCCCPKKGLERRCTAHVTSKRRFAWADGEKFPYWYNGRNGDINNYDPWKSSEIAIPSDIGIYNKSVGKFVDEYDPRFSNARSVTSKYD
ncbi:MAG: hypothetical protein BZ138_07720 [Methanosphaera sp. rholeuAM270]|nr:MAG: hypothetical protein BZ138_07720 [Methanosphaera sp. rholeuAM270]